MQYLITVYIFIFGTLIGSFLNCFIWRLYKREGLWNRSYCPKCRGKIAWYDNIPVLSYLILRARCRHCREHISVQYPVVEFITGVLFVLAFYNIFGSSDLISNFKFQISNSSYIQLLRSFFVISVMIVIFIYDLRWYLILDKVTLPACVIVIVLNLFLGMSLVNFLIAGVVGASFFLFQFVISRGRWIGGGDIRLGLLMGLILGWPHVLTAIFLAYFIGSFVGIALLVSGRKEWGSQIPLGIFLSTAAIMVLFWGDKILSWYFDLIRF